jgi:putative glycosyltransferase (TIGR04348 family)
VVVEQAYEGGRADVLVALHARRSAPSVETFREQHPVAPIVLALTGTDLYRDGPSDETVRRSLELSSCYVVLQRLACEELPEAMRPRCHVIYQSAVAPRGTFPRPRGVFQAAVLAHLRPVKDPLLAAAAARRLPPGSTVRVVHAGGALDEAAEQAARAEAQTNPRYRWLGELPRWQALRVLARSHVLVLTSRAEGGANVVSEALASSVPVLATRVAGSVGILGPDYPGYFDVGDADGLAAALDRAETSRAFYVVLDEACRRVRGLVEPAAERDAWHALVASLEEGAEELVAANRRRRS